MIHTMKTLNALQVADYLILKAQKDKEPITNKRLQKMLYYVQAWSVAVKNEAVFNNKIEAWIHGPAIKEVYLEYKNFGANPIEKNVTEEMVKDIPVDVRNFIDEVWSVYSKYDTPYLEYLTHSEEPWQIARKGIESHVSSENEISIDSMKVFYQRKLAQLEKVS